MVYKCKNVLALLLTILLFVNPSLLDTDITAYADEKVEISVNNEATVGNESLVVTDNINKDKVILDYEQLELKELVTKEDIDNGKHIKRMYEEEESLSHAVYLNEDGTRTAYYFMHPVKYKDSKGNVKDISLELKEDSKGNFVSAGSDVIATFPKNLNEGISLEKSEDDILITMHPVEGRNKKAFVLKEEVRTNANEYLVQYTYDENTSIEYQLTYTGIKENIVVKNYTGQTEYSFLINTNGLKLIEDERTLLLVDEKNTVKAVVGDVIIYTEDNVNNTFGELSFEAVKENESYLITIYVDEEFLSSPKTKYPIIIDPTIEINNNSGDSAISDTTINSAAGSNGSSTYLYAGRRDSVGISRILMKFPALDLSFIPASDKISSAYLRLKDVVQTQAEVQVQCYVFGGSIWDESTATWSNTSPNTITTHLADNTISYENGTSKLPVHTYIYDITKVVKGWRVGNMNPNKGIIFKIPNALEQGTEDVVKAFASYERSDGKPSLSVTYTTSGSIMVGDDTIYINNWKSGEYLGYYDGDLETNSGLIDSYGAKIKWILRKVDGGYVIRPSYYNTLYLAVPVDTSSADIEGVVVVDRSIPERCIWEISVVESGKITLKNKYNGKYLFDNGTYLNTTSTLSSSNEELYRKRVWRYVSVSDYISADTGTYSELDGSFSVNTCSTFSGKTIKPTIKSERVNLLWSDASDFTYTGYNSSQLSYNSLTGTFTSLSSSTSMYSTQVTATHKVSGRSTTFTLVVNPKAVFAAVESNDNRDRSSWFPSATDSIVANGISSVNATCDSYTASEILEKLDNDNNYIFVSRSHGYVAVNNQTEKITQYTSIVIKEDPDKDDGVDEKVIFSNLNISHNTDLSNMGLVIFAGCYTAIDGAMGESLAKTVVQKGAKSAIGFEERIDRNDANEFVRLILCLLQEDVTVNEALSMAKLVGSYNDNGIYTATLFGIHDYNVF